MTRLYFDFETKPIVPGLLAPPVVVMSFAYDGDAPQMMHIRPECNDLHRWCYANPIHDLLKAALEDDECIMVAHNASFEAAVTIAQFPHLVKKVFAKVKAGKWQCTMLRERQIRVARGDRREGLGLDALCSHYRTGIVLNKASYWRVRYGLLLNTPLSQFPEEAINYSLEDIAVRDVDKAQRAHSYEAEYIDHPLQMLTGVCLYLTSCNGFMTDGELAAEFVRETEAELEEHKSVVLSNGLARWKKSDGEFKVTMDKKAATALIVKAYEKLGREPPRKEATEKMREKAAAAGQDPDEALGNISVDADACKLSREPLLVSYSKFSQARTLLSKARRPLIAARMGVPVQCRYNVLMNTGRTSCSQGDDPEPGEAWTSVGMQTQNLPRKGKARECLIARPGHAIVSVDFDAFEMRTWAQVCAWLFGAENCALVAILNNPKRCPHVEMGTRLHDQYVDVEDWALAYAYGYGLKNSDKKLFKDLRGLAKGPNFGLPGGMGAARLQDYCYDSYGVTISLEMAELACRVWREIYPEAQPYLDWVKDQVGRRYGSRSQITQFVTERLRGDVGYTDAANGYFQGLAADIAKTAMGRIFEHMYCDTSSSLYGCRPLAFIHDEYLVEVPLERLHEAGHLIAHLATDTAMNMCPDVLFSAAPAAMYRWSKDAGDPVYVKDGKLSSLKDGGRLVVYEDRPR